MKKLKECYNLYINTSVDKDVLKSVNDDIIKYTTEIEDILNENENELMYCGYPVPDRKLVNKPTFYLHINTFGGSVYDGLGIYNIIRKLSEDYKVIAYCRGYIMSMGIPIILAATERYSYPDTTFMIHEIATFDWGKLSQVKEDIEETERLGKITSNIITNNTSITQDMLDDWFAHKKDVFMSAQQALDYKLIDKIL